MEEFIKTPAIDKLKPFSIENAGISYCDEEYKIYRKKSDVVVVEYVLEGSGTIETCGKSFFATRGDSYLLPMGREHLYYSSEEEPWSKIWINVTGRLADSLVDAYGLENQIVFKCNIKDLIEEFHTLLRDSHLSLDEMLSKSALCFHKIMQRLHEALHKTSTLSPDARIMKDYIDSNTGQSISTKKLASLIFKSPSQTIRIFKKQFGITPYDYHINNRIQKAISLLSGTNIPVREIAFSLGFGDEHYFSALFKQKTGKKPTDFRKPKE